jgi:FMN phosphatase YigB (HAD superfamily)
MMVARTKQWVAGYIPGFSGAALANTLFEDFKGRYGKKPDHTIFMKCLDELSVSPSEAVFVGDNPLADIEPAKSLWMRAVWLKNEHFPEPVLCDGIISNIPELIRLLEDVV